MRSLFFMAFGTSLFLAPINGSACAQQAVGRTLVDGKSVTLFDNGTWSYEGAQEEGCRTLGAGISFCGSSDTWKKTAPNGSDIAASFRYDDRNYAMVIVETVGVEDGVSLQFMRNAVVSNAADGANVPAEEIIVFGIEPYERFKYPTETVVYGASLDGLNLTYANTIITKPHQTLQLITYAVGTDYTQQHKLLHSDFVDSIELE
tara:strand:+ start:240 stop:851 length:612 start_codon:yes stop_codon:yes gene_type:complete